jgi:hypothetical protein
MLANMSESERVKVLLKLTDQTLHEKMDNLPVVDSKKGNINSSSKKTKRAPPVFAHDVPPVDSRMLYDTTNNTYSGLHSDNTKMLQHSQLPHSEGKKKFDWKRLGHVDVNGSEEGLNNQVKTVKSAMDSFEKNISRKEKKKKEK